MRNVEQPTSSVTVLQEQQPDIPDEARVMTILVELPPGNPGAPPHRHPGPVFGYMIEGEMLFEMEGEPERVIRAGEAFWETGGDPIHYKGANNLTDQWTRFVVHALCPPGEHFLKLVPEEELKQRESRRAPRP
ncbi:cupin domain-containing protein [Actinomadura harenae]|uniref:Cupin domain-containing protein n=1 Tax=Actinomadura harenae TaxID=2483351 RepID=A0A3M2LKV5_9ACTN|nr:cupin domain-containing protein [Actinomadura harenae]RMI38011.1 cupin domain-containing protein [Actinomadura harenae]